MEVEFHDLSLFLFPQNIYKHGCKIFTSLYTCKYAFSHTLAMIEIFMPQRFQVNLGALVLYVYSW